MNAFKAVSAVSTRHGYWTDFETNRHNKARSRRKARHVLNKVTKAELNALVKGA